MSIEKHVQVRLNEAEKQKLKILRHEMQVDSLQELMHRIVLAAIEKTDVQASRPAQHEALYQKVAFILSHGEDADRATLDRYLDFLASEIRARRALRKHGSR